MQTIRLGENGYPTLLSKIYAPPENLYVDGGLIQTLNAPGKVAVGIVGARRASAYGLDIAFGLARDLSGCGVTIVSGLAEGIDSAAHRGALLGVGKTIGVLGCGLDIVYPSHNGELYQALREQGSLVTEYEIGTPPLAVHFPARNRIISGLCRGVIVVEASRRSGALITGDFALEQGREVFAVPGNVKSAGSWGPHELIKSGARLVESAFDVLEELDLLNIGECEQQGRLCEQSDGVSASSLTADERRVLGLMECEPRHIDEIIRLSHLQTGSVNSILVVLELRKLVAQDAGKRYYRL